MLTGERGSTKQFVERTVWHPCYAVNILRKGGHKGEGNLGGDWKYWGRGGRNMGNVTPSQPFPLQKGGTMQQISKRDTPASNTRHGVNNYIKRERQPKSSSVGPFHELRRIIWR